MDISVKALVEHKLKEQDFASQRIQTLQISLEKSLNKQKKLKMKTFRRKTLFAQLLCYNIKKSSFVQKIVTQAKNNKL